jgi:hypothetical protein
VRSEVAVAEASSAIFLVHEAVDGEADAGIREVDDGVDALLIHPAPSNPDPDVRLVLVVGENDFDLEPARFSSEILRRKLSANQRSLAGLIGERTGEVAEHADLDGIARNLRRRARGQASSRYDGEGSAHEQPQGPSTHGRSSDCPSAKYR